MTLKIRLARGGAKKRPFYRIVLADSKSPRDGKFLERLGHYNPLLPREHDDRLKIDIERVRHWLGKGAQPTERVRRFLADAGVVSFKQPVRPKREAPRKKAAERLAAEQKAVAEATAALQSEAGEATGGEAGAGAGE